MSSSSFTVTLHDLLIATFIGRESGNRKITIYFSFPGGEDLFSDDALQCNFLSVLCFKTYTEHRQEHISLCISSV